MDEFDRLVLINKELVESNNRLIAMAEELIKENKALWNNIRMAPVGYERKGNRCTGFDQGYDRVLSAVIGRK